MAPAELVEALERAGAAGCNLEDTDQASGARREPARQAELLRAVREAADRRGYPLVINARIDDFLAAIGRGPPGDLLDAALARARAYLDAGADCVYPIALWERDVLAAFVDRAGGPVNALALPRAPSLAELGAMGVARVSWGTLLHTDAMARFAEA